MEKKSDDSGTVHRPHSKIKQAPEDAALLAVQRMGPALVEPAGGRVPYSTERQAAEQRVRMALGNEAQVTPFQVLGSQKGEGSGAQNSGIGTTMDLRIQGYDPCLPPMDQIVAQRKRLHQCHRGGRATRCPTVLGPTPAALWL